MNASTDYVTVEKIAFAIQSIDTVPPSEEGTLLDPLELEVSRVDELDYQVLTAMHNPAYTGGGSGEVFFPMEATDFSVGGRASGGFSSEPERKYGEVCNQRKQNDLVECADAKCPGTLYDPSEIRRRQP